MQYTTLKQFEKIIKSKIDRCDTIYFLDETYKEIKLLMIGFDLGRNLSAKAYNRMEKAVYDNYCKKKLEIEAIKNN